MATPGDRYHEARRRLYTAAMQLFQSRGFAATTAEAIAARAGFSRATFFNHFGSKAAVLRFYGQDLEDKVRHLAVRGSAPKDPLDEVKQILMTMAGEAESQRENLKIVFIHSLKDEAYLSGPSPARKRILLRLTDLLGQAQKRGEARTDLSAQEIAALVMGLYESAILGILFKGQKAAKAIDLLWKFALRGLAGTASAPTAAKASSKGVRAR